MIWLRLVTGRASWLVGASTIALDTSLARGHVCLQIGGEVQVAEMVYGPGLKPRTALLIGVTVVGLLLPLAWAAAAPRLAQPPPAAAVGPPVGVDASGPEVHLADRLDALPLVVSDFPDAPSRAAAAEYAHLRTSDPAPAAAMFTQAWAALAVPASDATLVSALGRRLLSGTFVRGDVPGEVDDVDTLNQAVGQVLDVLAADVANGDRLSNAAVALLGVGLAADSSASTQVPARSW